MADLSLSQRSRRARAWYARCSDPFMRPRGTTASHHEGNVMLNREREQDRVNRENDRDENDWREENRDMGTEQMPGQGQRKHTSGRGSTTTPKSRKKK